MMLMVAINDQPSEKIHCAEEIRGLVFKGGSHSLGVEFNYIKVKEKPGPSVA